MNNPQDDSAGELARLLFMIFVHVSDADKDITPYDVQRLLRLLENTSWTGNAMLRAGLERLKPEYSTMWVAYDSSALPVSIPLITRQLEIVLRPMEGDMVGPVRASLLEFIQKVGVPVTTPLSRLWLRSAATYKAHARDEITRLLAQHSSSPAAGSPDAPNHPSTASTPVGAIWPAATLTMSGDSCWTSGRINVRCVHVCAETHDVKTYSLMASPDRIFRYLPGQFVTLELPIGGGIVRRSYTLSSSPSRPHVLTITVKRVPDGVVSNWLYENMVEGFEFHLSGPHGRFSCLDHSAPKLLMISGGSGITPMMSMLRWLCDTRSPAEVVFINNVRTPSDVIFEQELNQISARMGAALRLAIVPGLPQSGRSWNGIMGLMNEQLLGIFAPDFLEREVFVCGPPGYMSMVKTMLARLGANMSRVHYESFGTSPAAASPAATSPAATSPAATSPATTSPATVEVRRIIPSAPARPAPAPIAGAAADVGDTMQLIFERSKTRVNCSPRDFILDVAERHGIALPSGCRSGVCGTCRLRKLQGTVAMDDQQALSELDIQDGYVLACVGRVCGRAVIDA